MKRKIIFALAVLILAVGMAAAVNMNDFQFPSGFHQMDGVPNSYMNDNSQAFVIFEYNSSSQRELLTNSSGYGIQPFKDNINIFADVNNHLSGVIEVVNFKGNKYIVMSTIPDSLIDSHSTDAYNSLLEFNRLNNVNPVAV